MRKLTPIAAGLWTDEAEPRLIGGRRKSDGEILFPCPSDVSMYEPVTLSRRGKLWSWTIQSFRPKSPPYKGPEVFESFALGYVELPGEVIVESRLTRMEDLKIGMEMELVIAPFGDDRAMFAFAPVSAS